MGNMTPNHLGEIELPDDWMTRAAKKAVRICFSGPAFDPVQDALDERGFTREIRDAIEQAYSEQAGARPQVILK